MPGYNWANNASECFNAVQCDTALHATGRTRTEQYVMIGSMDNAQRYLLLRDWLLEQKIITFHESSRKDTEPFVMGEHFYGETFEEAVDSL